MYLTIYTPSDNDDDYNPPHVEMQEKGDEDEQNEEHQEYTKPQKRQRLARFTLCPEKKSLMDELKMLVGPHGFASISRKVRSTMTSLDREPGDKEQKVKELENWILLSKTSIFSDEEEEEDCHLVSKRKRYKLCGTSSPN